LHDAQQGAFSALRPGHSDKWGIALIHFERQEGQLVPERLRAQAQNAFGHGLERADPQMQM
jgi:hypothetical protein